MSITDLKKKTSKIVSLSLIYRNFDFHLQTRTAQDLWWMIAKQAVNNGYAKQKRKNSFHNVNKVVIYGTIFSKDMNVEVE